MSIETGIAAPVSPFERPIIDYAAGDVVVANTTPEALAQSYVKCCDTCGKVALRVASEIIDLAPAPGRNMTIGKAVEVLQDRVGTHQR